MHYDKSTQKVRVCAGSRACQMQTASSQGHELPFRAHRAGERLMYRARPRPPALGSQAPYLYAPCPTHSEPERSIRNV